MFLVIYTTVASGRDRVIVR